jgi:hypothetical protein
VARAIVRLLLAELRGEPAEPRGVLLAPRLVVRDSSAGAGEAGKQGRKGAGEKRTTNDKRQTTSDKERPLTTVL